jgi:hypothetical protein
MGLDIYKNRQLMKEISANPLQKAEVEQNSYSNKQKPNA